MKAVERASVGCPAGHPKVQMPIFVLLILLPAFQGLPLGKNDVEGTLDVDEYTYIHMEYTLHVFTG